MDAELCVGPFPCQIHQSANHAAVFGDVLGLQQRAFILLGKVLVHGGLPIGLLVYISVLCKALILFVVAPDVPSFGSRPKFSFQVVELLIHIEWSLDFNIPPLLFLHVLHEVLQRGLIPHHEDVINMNRDVQFFLHHKQGGLHRILLQSKFLRSPNEQLEPLRCCRPLSW